MSQLSFLGNVIRKLNGNRNSNSSTETVIIIDRKTGKAIAKKPLFGGKLAYYLVSNNDDPSNTAERENLIYKLKDFENDLETELNINYRVSCNPGYEKKLAEALHSEDLLENEMDKKVQKWVARFTQNNTTYLINNYLAQIPELTKFVKNNIQQEVGVNIELKVSLDKEYQLKSFPIASIKFPVFVKDCDDDLELSLATELLITESNKIKAILHYGRELLLVNKIKSEVKNHLINNVTLHRFCYELKDSVRDELISHLNKNLYDYGRQLKYLSLESDSVSPGQELLDNRSYDIECTVEGYPDPILVKNRLYMQPLDIGKYRLANSPDLQYWAEDKLKSIVQPLLLQKEYIEVLLDFIPIAETIKNQMIEAAREIGYQITHLVSKPNLEPLKLLENFNLEQANTFPTRDGRVQVQLDIFVTAKINNLANIKDYLYQQVDVKDLMKTSIYNATRQYLTQIEPERFYMRFFQHDLQLGEQQSVEQELIEKIKKELEGRFSARVSIVVPKTLDTDITKCYQDLHRQIVFCEFEILSLRGGEPIPYKGDFQVQAVEKNSWYTFQSRQPSLNEIKESIERSIHSKLNTFSNDDLQYVDLEDSSDIENIINELARNSVINQFGLEIKISHFTRTRTESEVNQVDASQQLRQADVEEVLARIEARREKRQQQLEMSSIKNQAQLDELKRLHEQKLKLSGDEENEEELEYINEKITSLEQENLNPSLEDAKNTLKILEPKREKSKGFRKLAKQMNLPTSETNPLLDSSNDRDVVEKDDNDSD